MTEPCRTAAASSARSLLAALIAAVVVMAIGAHPGAARAQQATTRDGVTVGEKSRAIGLASSAEVERQAMRQYDELKRQAAAQRALAPDDHPQLQRLRRIAAELIPKATRFNDRASAWQWEVNLIGSRQINAFCMPGGKIAFFTGIIDTLKLTDDEIAQVMGHEMAHALREHGRERVGKSRIAQGLTLGASVLSQILGYGDLGGQLASAGAQLTLLKYGRDDETEADAIGMDLAARAGYDPRAGIVLWEKMAAAARGQPPQWLSTHPSNKSRIEQIRKRLPEVMPLYAKAKGVAVDTLPPYPSKATGSSK